MPHKEHRHIRAKVIGKILGYTSDTVRKTIKELKEADPAMKITINPVHETPPQVKGGKKTKRRIKRNRKTYRRKP